MNNEERKKLIDKYLAGESNFEEEEKLQNADLSDAEGLDLWFQYLDLKKKKAPRDLNEILWEESSLSKSGYKHLIIPIVSVAASIALLFLFVPQFTGPTNQNYEDPCPDVRTMCDILKTKNGHFGH